MALRDQLITKEFPELDRVERLNNEAFPEEERIPLSEFLQLDGREDYHFFAFTMRMILLVLPRFSTMLKFLCQFLCHRTSNAESWLREVRLLINWWTFMDHRVLWSWK